MRLEGAAVPGLEPVQAGIAVAAVAEQRELVLGDAEALQHLLGFAEVGGAAADECQRIAHEIVDARIEPRQIAHGGDVARLGDQREGLAAIEDFAEIRQGRDRAIAGAGAFQD